VGLENEVYCTSDDHTRSKECNSDCRRIKARQFPAIAFNYIFSLSENVKVETKVKKKLSKLQAEAEDVNSTACVAL